MTEKEVLQMMTLLQTAYPRFYMNMSQRQMTEAERLWAFHFSDRDAKAVFTAVNRLIATRMETWPPSIGEVNNALYELERPAEMTPMAAWGCVKKALSNSKYHSVEEYEKLPPEVRSMVTPEQLSAWAHDPDFNDGVTSSHFMSAYKERRQNAKNAAMLPANIRAMIGDTAQRMIGAKE